ncbi:hypothetical protein Dsin_009342 [Dipteronia sinensis]|uniref:DDE Tnp4 domain-containing protein n=1 Tax=Dipteronia sinensis TaxID=43782 RepID=A0AAE0AQS3_9ROSI|nr:hypothetical protein Dsin_009342 [Dipteronia sinensis]
MKLWIRVGSTPVPISGRTPVPVFGWTPVPVFGWTSVPGRTPVLVPVRSLSTSLIYPMWDSEHRSLPASNIVQDQDFRKSSTLLQVHVCVVNLTQIVKCHVTFGWIVDFQTNANFWLRFEVFDIISKSLVVKDVTLANGVELFNLCHASLRNVIERIFGIFKSRFTIFNSAPPFPFRIQTELISVYVGLHNFLQKECRSDEFPIEQDNEVDHEPINEVDPKPVFQTQEQQRTEDNEWRDVIALNMWMDARTQ